jgi:hypothetical protein
VRLVIVFSPRFGFLVLGIGCEPVEARRPEALVTAQPFHRLAHRLGPEPHRHRAAGFRAGDEARAVEHVEMLHHRGQLDGEGLRKFADG